MKNKGGNMASNLNFTDLVLLIGTNPLPNYVAAKYFMGANNNLERIWMVCSEKKEIENQETTKKYANALQSLLNIEASNKKLDFPDLIFVSDIGSKDSIERSLRRILEKTKNKSLLLFFTGGTKAMSTYSYSYLKNELLKFSASYLSARSFKIKFDNGGISDNLKKSIKITFDDLLKLHLFENEKDEANKYNGFENVIRKFEEIIAQRRISSYYSKNGGFERNIFILKGKDGERIFKNMDKIFKAAENDEYFQQALSTLKNNERNNFKRRTNILKKIKNYQPNDMFLEIINSFPKKYRIYENGMFNTGITEQDYKKVIDFMDGFWFEQYVGNLIKENLEHKFDEILLNQKPYNINDKGNNFELDIALVKGYQLITISCTTSNKKFICKNKGFEVILRTEQIGGEGAKSILITRAGEDVVQKLQSELMLSTGATQENILVVGEKDWLKDRLIKKIDDFID